MIELGSAVTFVRGGETVVGVLAGTWTDRLGHTWATVVSSDPEDYWQEPIENVREIPEGGADR